MRLVHEGDPVGNVVPRERVSFYERTHIGHIEQ